jgi:hypothetical protein
MADKDQILDTLPNYDADNAQMPNEVSGLNTQFEGNPYAQSEGSAAGATPAGAPAPAQGGLASRAGGQRWRTGLALLGAWLAWRGLRRRRHVSRL